MTAEEIMTGNVKTIDETGTLGEALEIMREAGIRHLPVVRGEQLVGMLSDRDIKQLGVSLVTDLESLERLKARLSTSVSGQMSGNVLSVSRVSEVSELIDLMIDEKLSAVPVVGENDRLVGIVSYIDVLRALRNSL